MGNRTRARTHRDSRTYRAGFTGPPLRCPKPSSYSTRCDPDKSTRTLSERFALNRLPLSSVTECPTLTSESRTERAHMRAQHSEIVALLAKTLQKVDYNPFVAAPLLEAIRRELDAINSTSRQRTIRRLVDRPAQAQPALHIAHAITSARSASSSGSSFPSQRKRGRKQHPKSIRRTLSGRQQLTVTRYVTRAIARGQAGSIL